MSAPAVGPAVGVHARRALGRGRRARSHRRAPLLLLVPALVAAAVALLPLWYLADRALGGGLAGVADEVLRRRTLDLVVRSLALTAVVTAGCVVVGVTAAWLVVRSDLPGRRALGVLLALPLAIPSYVSAFAWVSWRPWLAGFRGAALVLVLASYPYVYLPVVAALRRLDPAQEEVARSLGHGPLRVAAGLSLRQVRPAVAAGALLVALYVLSDFGAVATMRYEAFTWVIYGAYRAGFDPSRAAILALVLVTVALVLVAGESHVRGSAAYSRIGSGAPRRQPPVPLGRATPLAVGFVLVVLGAALVFPVAMILRWMVAGAGAGFDAGALLDALRSTLWVSGLAAVAATALALPVGVLAARSRGVAARGAERATYVAHALPGIVVAIAMVFVGVRLLRPVYQEVPLLVLAYVVLFLPLAVGSTRSSVEQSPVRLEEVARSLGRPPRSVLARVTAPLAAPGIAAGALLVLLTAMKELPATLLLHPTGMETLATRLWRHTAVSDYGAAGPYALALVVVAALPAALLGLALAERRPVRREDRVSNSVPALEVRGLAKRFGATRVLDAVDLDVPEGSVTAVLGPSGCGKTTLLRLVAGFEAPDAGTIRLRGRTVASDTSAVPPEQRRVGVVPQEGALFPHLSVGQNVGFGLRRDRQAKARVAECLSLVGLPGREAARPHELSGGQQQRVALARALAPRPALVVLDEPFSALDAGLRAVLREDVAAAVRADGATAVLVTHDQDEALSIADQVVVLLAGRVAQAGSPADLYTAPASLEVATFVGDAVVLDGRRRGRVVDTPLGPLPVHDASPAPDGPVVVVVRPEQLRVDAAGTAGTVAARSLAASYHGHDATARLALTGCETGTVPVTARVAPADLPAPGAEVGVRACGSAHCFAVPDPDAPGQAG